MDKFVLKQKALKHEISELKDEMDEFYIALQSMMNIR